MSEKTFNATRVYKQINSGGATLEEIADEYGLSMDYLCKISERTIGSKNFEALKKQSARNAKTRQKEEEKQSEEQVVEEVSETVKQKGDFREEKQKELQKELQKVQSGINKQMDLIKKDVINCRDAQKKVEEAEVMLQTAQNELEEAKRIFAKIKAKRTIHENAFRSLRKRKEEINQQLEELQNYKIYLIAPNYLGELPSSGRLISSVKSQNEKIVNDSGEEVMKEPTMSDIFDSGFENISEFEVALQFAKLVLKYYLNEDEANITVLVDDERIKNVLRQQYIVV